MKFEFKGKEYYIDGYLASQLDSIVYNVKKDWDFVIMITGNRMVRVGKSILAMTVCAYLARGVLLRKVDRKPMNKDAYCMENVFFDNKTLVEKAQELPKFSVLHYDEGREGLAANKAMKSFQQDLIDFFTECGQLNHIFVIVAPDFFDLKEDIAVGRSEILLNVYRGSESVMRDIYNTGTKAPITKFTRGNFQFFSRKKKAKLFDLFRTTRRKSYSLTRPDFIGRFVDQYTIDEVEYKGKKRESLERFKERHEEQKEVRNSARPLTIVIVKNLLADDPKISGKKVSEILEKTYELDVTERTCRQYLQDARKKVQEDKEYAAELNKDIAKEVVNKPIEEQV